MTPANAACVFAAAHGRHAHIYDQCAGLLATGARLKWVYDPEPARAEALWNRFPQARVARSLNEILEDGEVRLVTAAAVTNERAELGATILRAGKDYLTDKAPFTTLLQADDVAVAEGATGRRYWVNYAGRWASPAVLRACELVREGAIGLPVQLTVLGPHRLSPRERPAWFFERNRSGGILCDLGSHAFELYLELGGAADATVHHASTRSVANPAYPEFEDFGEASVGTRDGLSLALRVDWLSPGGLSTWGDARVVILGTTGFIEVRPCIDVGREATGEHLYLVDGHAVRHLTLAGETDNRFYTGLVADCLARTDCTQTAARVQGAGRLALRAQAAAEG